MRTPGHEEDEEKDEMSIEVRRNKKSSATFVEREQRETAAAGKKKLGVGDPLASEKEDDRLTD